jgi:hypothetical protein
LCNGKTYILIDWRREREREKWEKGKLEFKLAAFIIMCYTVNSKCEPRRNPTSIMITTTPRNMLIYRNMLVYRLNYKGRTDQTD